MLIAPWLFILDLCDIFYMYLTCNNCLLQWRFSKYDNQHLRDFVQQWIESSFGSACKSGDNCIEYNIEYFNQYFSICSNNISKSNIVSQTKIDDYILFYYIYTITCSAYFNSQLIAKRVPEHSDSPEIDIDCDENMNMNEHTNLYNINTSSSLIVIMILSNGFLLNKLHVDHDDNHNVWEIHCPKSDFPNVSKASNFIPVFPISRN